MSKLIISLPPIFYLLYHNIFYISIDMQIKVIYIDLKRKFDYYTIICKFSFICLFVAQKLLMFL